MARRVPTSPEEQAAADEAAVVEFNRLSLLRVAAAEPGSPADLRARRYAAAIATVDPRLPPVERLRELWRVIDGLGERDRCERFLAHLAGQAARRRQVGSANGRGAS